MRTLPCSSRRQYLLVSTADGLLSAWKRQVEQHRPHAVYRWVVQDRWVVQAIGSLQGGPAAADSMRVAVVVKLVVGLVQTPRHPCSPRPKRAGTT